MPRYRANEAFVYFGTVTVLDWLPVLIESRYIDPIITSLQYCRENKGLSLYGFVIMPNHIHLIAYADNRLEGVIRDFKRFTASTINSLLREDGRLSILEWLRKNTSDRRREKGELGFWQPGFHPKALFSEDVFEQKLRYVHENPVRKGLVRRPEDWWYSSAGEYEGATDVCLHVDFPEF